MPEDVALVEIVFLEAVDGARQRVDDDEAIGECRLERSALEMCPETGTDDRNEVEMRRSAHR